MAFTEIPKAGGSRMKPQYPRRKGLSAVFVVVVVILQYEKFAQFRKTTATIAVSTQYFSSSNFLQLIAVSSSCNRLLFSRFSEKFGCKYFMQLIPSASISIKIVDCKQMKIKDQSNTPLLGS